MGWIETQFLSRFWRFPRHNEIIILITVFKHFYIRNRMRPQNHFYSLLETAFTPFDVTFNLYWYTICSLTFYERIYINRWYTINDYLIKDFVLFCLLKMVFKGGTAGGCEDASCQQKGSWSGTSVTINGFIVKRKEQCVFLVRPVFRV